MKEYRKINDLSDDLKNEINVNNSFFNDFDGKSLDEQQRIVCVLNDCDLEIIAGAGTGKTYTLLAKAAYLIEKRGIDSSEILFLSFSKSSVKDLSERLKYPIETRTIHSFGLSIINSKDVIEEYEFLKIFKRYLEDASEKELDDINYFCENFLASYNVRSRLKELDYEEEKFNYLIKETKFPYKIQRFLDLFKGKNYDISYLKKLKKRCEKEFDEKFSLDVLQNIYFLNVFEPIFRFYQSFLSKNNLIDYNDMINQAIKIIDEKDINLKYKYIFVDEYQDMSYNNFLLVKTVKDKTNANLIVVGDDWQSIYGFRDSDLKLFTDFDKYFPNAKRVFLEKTYRNSQQLIDTAGKFIMNNENQFVKSLNSDLSIEKPIKIIYHSQGSEKENNIIYNLVSNLSNDNTVLIIGRHKKDINEFLVNTNLIKKGRSKNYKKITDKANTIDNVKYRTIHKAKGLEADYVIIIRAIDDFMGFPNKLSIYPFMKLIHDWNYGDKLEEERRLFYVALTRAKKGVYIFTVINKESEYINELKKDNLKNLEIIYTDDKSTYSHLKEFNKIEKPKKIKKQIKKIPFADMDSVGDDDIDIKSNLKKMGNDIIKSKEYDDAIDFYNKLLTNKFFINDYYPYRKLVEVYEKKYNSKNVISTIKKFFESGLYCNESQLLWFKLKYKKACIKTNSNFNEFQKYLGYFEDNGFKNKDKQNIPVPISARIQINKNQVKIISQEVFDKKSKKKELEYNYKFAREYESYEKALYYFEQLWQQKGFNKNLTAYKRLCMLYFNTGQYEKVIEISNEYFKSNARKTKTSPLWFEKKIKKAKSKLNTNSQFNNKNLLKKNIGHENNFTNPNSQCNVITISSENFSKLLSCNIGDKVIIKQDEYNFISMKLEIVDIKNPNQKYNEFENNSKKVKVNVVKKDYNIIKKFDLISFRHNTLSGEIILKHSRY